MSGFEIAGVVLGAFPIIITTLDKYREVAKMWGFWWEIRSQYLKCANEVKYHQLTFSRNLKQLLLPMIADKTQIQRLLAEPGGDEWRQKDIARLLEDRLQDSNELYLEIMKQLQITIEELRTELAVDKAEFQKSVSSNLEKPAQPKTKQAGSPAKRPFSKSNREYEMYRVKFALGEAKRKTLFEELKDYNERLEKLLTTSDAICQLESKHENLPKASKRAVDNAIAHIWRHADRLYKALSRAWVCSSQHQHRAKIMLQHRVSAADMDFMLVFVCRSSGPNNDSNAWEYRNTRVKLLDPPPKNALYTTISISPEKEATIRGDKDTKKYKSILSSRGSKAKGKQPATINNHVKSNIQGSCSQGLPGFPEIQGDEIQNLCATFSSKLPQKSCYGFLEDDHKRYYIQSTSGADAAVNIENTITLDDLFRHKHEPPLSRRQRYRLSLTLASSFLQLRESAWLSSASWNRCDITFLRDTDNTSILMLDRPYITSDFSISTNEQAKVVDGVKGIPFLGILLIELCFGSLIEDHPSRKKYPVGDDKTGPMFDMLAAVEWLREVGDEAGPDYASAAEWCLLGSRTMTNADAWRRMLFENVVQPLERCHLYLNPPTEGLLTIR